MRDGNSKESATREGSSTRVHVSGGARRIYFPRANVSLLPRYPFSTPLCAAPLLPSLELSHLSPRELTTIIFVADSLEATGEEIVDSTTQLPASGRLHGQGTYGKHTEGFSA